MRILVPRAQRTGAGGGEEGSQKKDAMGQASRVFTRSVSTKGGGGGAGVQRVTVLWGRRLLLTSSVSRWETTSRVSKGPMGTLAAVVEIRSLGRAPWQVGFASRLFELLRG